MKGLMSLLIGVAFLLPVTAAAEDAELQADVDAAHQQYGELWSAGDIDGLLELFAEDAIFFPVAGGQYEGHEGIREGLAAEPTPSQATIQGTHLERMNGVILDMGTFDATMPDPVGEMQGEYVALLVETDDGIRIARLVGFPRRQPPPAEQ